MPTGRKSLAQVLSYTRWELPAHHRAPFWRRVRPEQLFVGSFLALIVFGTLGLKLLPRLVAPGHSLTWLDALFTVTSAVCVTGLQIVDFEHTFTFWGQLWMLALIQLGGLGVIALSSVIILALGGRLSLRAETISVGSFDVAPRLNRAKLIRDVVVFTLVIELIGAAALFGLWRSELSTGEAIWHATFHSISAFCNAGFSTYGNDSLIEHASSAGVLLVVGALVLLGGFGFLSMEEIYRRLRPAARNLPHARLSIHTRLAVVTSLVLLLVGWAAFALLEWTNPRTLGQHGFVDRAVNALFLSLTPRSAGFNTVDYAQTRASTNFLTILLMSVGGSPGSAAGGVKTTTFALVLLLAWSRFRGRTATSVWGRTVPEETIQRAVGLFVFWFGLLTLATLTLTATENREGRSERLLPFMFEAASAFNTAGLSMNETGNLSLAGRINMILMMFVGRVGPLTFAAAIALAEGGDRKFRFAKEDVVVG